MKELKQDWYTPTELLATGILPFKSREFLMKALKSGKIKSVKVGNRFKISRDRVIEYLAQSDK